MLRWSKLKVSAHDILNFAEVETTTKGEREMDHAALNWWQLRKFLESSVPIYACKTQKNVRHLTLSQATHFRLVQIERVCRQQFQIL